MARLHKILRITVPARGRSQLDAEGLYLSLNERDLHHEGFRLLHEAGLQHVDGQRVLGPQLKQGRARDLSILARVLSHLLTDGLYLTLKERQLPLDGFILLPEAALQLPGSVVHAELGQLLPDAELQFPRGGAAVGRASGDTVGGMDGKGR